METLAGKQWIKSKMTVLQKTKSDFKSSQGLEQWNYK